MDRGQEKRQAREQAVAAAVAAKAQWRHQRALARRERVLLRARRAVPVQGGVAVVGTGLLVLGAGPAGLWGSVVAVCGVLTVRAVAVLRHPPPVPVAPVLPAPPPPALPAWSSAGPSVLRLDRARAELHRLVALVGPEGRAVAEQAWQAAAEADTALRWQAARLSAVEPHRGTDPVLLHALDDGAAGQERLVVAMADLVVACDPLLPGGPARVQDAADALHGLAHGLRALR